MRLALFVVAGLAAAALASENNFWVRGMVGWDVAASLTLLYQAAAITVSDEKQTRLRAAMDDPGRTIVWLLLLAACAFSLMASLILMGDFGQQRWLLVASMWSVLASWLLTHTSFTLRYAHLYYREDGDVGGLGFPGEEAPDDLDFAYFAFTLGMCFQVSDVTILDRQIRRTALFHAVISFFYNTAILALVFNLIFGHLGSLL